MNPPCGMYRKGIIFKPLRGKKTPPEDRDLRNQFVWWYPDFIPVEKPFVAHNTSANG